MPRSSARHSCLLVVETLPLGWQPPGGGSHAFAMRVFADEEELAGALGERGWFTAVRARS